MVLLSHKNEYDVGSCLSCANVVKQIVYDDGGGRFGGENCK